MNSILGIVLAAGRSERMGRAKALLPLGVRTFLRAAVDTLHQGGCEDVVVVVASTDVEAEARAAGARVVWNDAPDSEQLDSLRLGLAAAQGDTTAAVVLPVDHPLVRPDTVAALIDAHRSSPDAVARPVHEGQPGHPTLFPRSLWPSLLADPLPRGARSVVEAPETERADVVTDDPGVVADIDTPEAYARQVPPGLASPDDGRADRATPAATVSLTEAARAALDARRGGRPVVVVGRADDAGHGRRLLVFADGAVRGTLGSVALDRSARSLAAELHGDPDADARTRPADDPSGAELYAELHRSPGRLFIVGAGHIAVPLARTAHLLGFPVVVLDDRDEFATDDRFPIASRVLRVNFADPFAEVAPGPGDFVVLVTRAHRYDFDCLRRLVGEDAPPRYTGMVGSRRRIRAAFRALVDDGVPPERLATIHAPIGLDIGAETPEEIAVAIAAELVAVRRGVAPGGSLRDRERVVERWLGEP